MMKLLVMDVGGTAIKSAVIDDTDQLTDIRVSPSCTHDIDERIRRVIEVAKSYGTFDAVSVATTGQIDDRTRSMLFRYSQAKETVLPSYPIGEIIEKALGRPAFILNDCNAAALGEAYFGAGRGHRNFLCLTVGTGVGGAIIEDGKLYTGQRGIAGEVGHMVTHKGGKLCRCGRRGCYEQYASTTALVQRARTLYPELENAKNIFDMAERDAALGRVISSWTEEIVAGLLTLTYIFNPSCMILGGGVMQEPCMCENVRRRFYKSVIPTFAGVEILTAELGNRAGLFGAAVYARQCLETGKHNQKGATV